MGKKKPQTDPDTAKPTVNTPDEHKNAGNKAFMEKDFDEAVN